MNDFFAEGQIGTFARFPYTVAKVRKKIFVRNKKTKNFLVRQPNINSFPTILCRKPKICKFGFANPVGRQISLFVPFKK